MRGDIDPKQPFYLALSGDFTDGSVGVDWDGNKGFMTLAETISFAKEEAEEHGVETYIFLCTPIKRVCRGQVRVIELKKHEP